MPSGEASAGLHSLCPHLVASAPLAARLSVNASAVSLDGPTAGATGGVLFTATISGGCRQPAPSPQLAGMASIPPPLPPPLPPSPPPQSLVGAVVTLANFSSPSDSLLVSQTAHHTFLSNYSQKRALPACVTLDRITTSYP